MLCDLAQGQFHTAVAQADLALNESRGSGEDHLSERIHILRAQANTFLGKRDSAETALEQLRLSSISHHTNCSLTFVHTLLMLSDLRRARRMVSSTPGTLVAIKDHLTEAERTLDELLERDGWIGVGVNVDSGHDERLNLYHPGIATYIHVKASLAQALVECEIDFSLESLVQRQDRALQTIENGLRAVSHTTAQVALAKATLFLLKGAILKKFLVSQHVSKRAKQKSPKDLPHDSTASTDTSLEDDKKERLLTDAVDALRECIETSIQSGGYDRYLVRLALIELVDLYAEKLLSGKEDEHIQVAFHYLSLAVQVQSHESTLFESLELQNGTISSLDKLPPFISEAINGVSPTSQPDTKHEPPPISVANAKKSGSVATAIPDAGRNSLQDSARIINYYLRLQREQHVFPACCSIQQESVAWLHSFLLKNHSSYAKCCLHELPKVPVNDPEIMASLVCVQWGRDLTPAINEKVSSLDGNSDKRPSTKLTLYVTLGTTKVDISCSEEYADAAAHRMEDFLQAPLLSKKSGMNEEHVNKIRERISHLRTQIENEESLVIDRATFDIEFNQILYSIQALFQPHLDQNVASSGQTEGWSDSQASSGLRDKFDNPIHLACTLEMVGHLESLFTVSKGLSTSDNLLCYFLRDLLDIGEL
ncbi:hypothetical protein FI667_g3443, partial [Globisporangium splendens]